MPRNEGFVCDWCGFNAPPASGTFRNHCPACLASKHVDGPTPGDRSETCGGLMPALEVEGVDPDSLDLVHRCEKCGFTRRNKIASDDNREVIVALMKQK
ncbi:RNHCP domain-containing protein [bacterium]|nr:RNHCP domain-containing protein [bacterium]